MATLLGARLRLDPSHPKPSVEKGDWLREKRRETRRKCVAARCLSPFSTQDAGNPTEMAAREVPVPIFNRLLAPGALTPG